MKVKTMPVKLRDTGGNSGKRQVKSGSADFLSILKERSQGKPETELKPETEPVKHAETKEEKKEIKKEEKKDIKKAEQNGIHEAEIMSGQNSREQPMDKEISAEQIKTGENYAAAESVSSSGEENINTLIYPGGIFNGEVKGVETGMSGGRSPAEEMKTSEAIGNEAKEAGTVSVMNEVLNDASASKKAEGKPEVFKMDGSVRMPKNAQGMENREPDAGKMPDIINTAKANGEGTESGSFGSGKENQDSSKWFSLDRSIYSKGTPEDKAAGETKEQVSLEELQKKAEKNVFLPFERLVGARLSGSAGTQAAGNTAVTDVAPLPEQIRSGIEQGLEKQLSQFTIRLKPEGMGEILVHMASTGGKISLSIGVSNLETQKILSGEMMHLKETLAPLNAEVQEIYHNSQGGMDMMSHEQGFFQSSRREQPGQPNGRRVRKESGKEEVMAETAVNYGLNQEYGRLPAYI